MARFSYVDRAEKAVGPMPYLRLSLSYRGWPLDVSGLVDSGASISILPYHVGLSLGAVWEEQQTSFLVTGSFGTLEARGLRVMASHPQLREGIPFELVFGWVRSDDMRVLFGQMSFFLEFDICFYRSLQYFDIQRSQTE